MVADSHAMTEFVTLLLNTRTVTDLSKTFTNAISECFSDYQRLTNTMILGTFTFIHLPIKTNIYELEILQYDRRLSGLVRCNEPYPQIGER